MAVFSTSLFFKEGKQYSVGSVTFDLLLSENHNFENTVTSHTIEDGSEISDHIKNELENGGVNGLISNFSVNTARLSSNRAQDAFDTLYNLWKAKTLVTIVTVLRVYENVAITSIPISRSEATGESLTFSISFQEIKQVTPKTVVIETSVRVSDMSVTQNRQSAATSDQGRTVPK